MLQTPERSSTGLEDLPFELRVMILHLLPDVDTLRSLRLASRTYYKTSLTEINVILTNIALRHLEQLDIEIDQFRHAVMVHFNAGTKSNRASFLAFPALRNLKKQVLASNSKRIVLKARDSLALLRIRDLVAWWTEERECIWDIVTMPDIGDRENDGFRLSMGEYYFFGPGCSMDQGRGIDQITLAYQRHMMLMARTMYADSENEEEDGCVEE